MYYIHAIASISHQDSFRNQNILDGIVPLTKDSELVLPNYKEFIPGGALRRLSPILRMGLACSVECQNQVENEFDSIVVGTALGCLKDTEKFLVSFHTTKSEFLSPTPFIQSTHNTIGGQISLGLKNHAYNMTHTQNNLSFEVSLLDAMMCVNEGKKNVLVGSVDEKIDFLSGFKPKLIPSSHPLSSCASFFAISSDESADKIGINSVAVSFDCNNTDVDVLAFLEVNEILFDNIDLLLFNDNTLDIVESHPNGINYLDFTGVNFSSSAFATHIAHDYLLNNDSKNALIVNNMCEGNLGLTLVSKK